MSPKKSSELPELPELPLLRELPELRELEPEELLRELELDDREPLLKDWPPPGRASKKVTRGLSEAPSNIAERAGAAMARTTATAPANNVERRRRLGSLMRVARRAAH
jgi:hypothetical protein